MEYAVELPGGQQYYFLLLAFFLGGYWLAYIFKNLTSLIERKGWIVFVFLMIGFFSVLFVVVPNVEASEDYFITGAYMTGFALRFFSHDH